eukprot:4093161-Prymnesium_polylepis.1
MGTRAGPWAGRSPRCGARAAPLHPDRRAASLAAPSTRRRSRAAGRRQQQSPPQATPYAEAKLPAARAGRFRQKGHVLLNLAHAAAESRLAGARIRSQAAERVDRSSRH